MGLRRLLIAAAVGLSALLVVPPPAGAVERCPKWERKVFAITATGGLVQHTFCVDATRKSTSRWTGERVIATGGWSDTATVFWSGKGHDFGGVYYRVSASTGTLFWSNNLTSWRKIGADRDWRAYTSLLSTEPGVIYGTDASGTLRRWTHLGWQDGSDQWGAEVPVSGLAGARLLGSTADGFVGMTAAPNVVQVWTLGLTSKFRIFVPPVVELSRLVAFDMEQRYPNSAFGLTADGKIVVLVPNGCAQGDRLWQADDQTGGGYRLIFLGAFVPYGGGPVEWQCGNTPPGPVN
ncbi:hypothetical protein ACWEIJ_21515 [Lentzea sp. NPDC004789]